MGKVLFYITGYKMQKLFLICLVIVIYSCPVFAQANNSRFLNFGSKDGLQDKVVYCATQDKLGYRWFGTPSGLYRYDGHNFKIFRSPIDKPGRTISNILQSVYCDKSGNLWLGCLNTMQWYNPVQDRFWSPDEHF